MGNIITFWVTFIFIRSNIDSHRTTNSYALFHRVESIVNLTEVDIIMKKAGTHVNNKIVWFEVTEWEMHIKAV